MPAAYPRNVPGTVAATYQHAALLRLLGFVELPFVVLHCTLVLGFGLDGAGLGMGHGAYQDHCSKTKDFFHD